VNLLTLRSLLFQGDGEWIELSMSVHTVFTNGIIIEHSSPCCGKKLHPSYQQLFSKAIPFLQEQLADMGTLQSLLNALFISNILKEFDVCHFCQDLDAPGRFLVDMKKWQNIPLPC
jgi:hypothetical protein